MMRKLARDEAGIALVTVLILSAVVLIMAAGVLFFVTQSTTMSGVTKSYATAVEAADGSISVLKDAIGRRMRGGALPPMLSDSGGCFDNAIVAGVPACTVALALPSAVGADFNVTITVERLYAKGLAGGRLEFGRSAGSGGYSNVAVYYRITATAVGPKNTRAEKSILYRLSS